MAERALGVALRGLFRDLSKMDAYCTEAVMEATLCLPVAADSVAASVRARAPMLLLSHPRRRD